MSRCLALALVALSCTWQFCEPWYYDEYAVWWTLVLLAYAALAIDASTESPIAIGRFACMALAAAMILPAFALGWPFRLGPTAIEVGAVLLLLPERRLVRRLGRAAIAVGVLHLVQSLVIAMFHGLGPRLNSTHVLGPACLAALRLCGLDVALVEGNLVFAASDPQMVLAPTPNNAGAVHLAIGVASILAVRAYCGNGLAVLLRSLLIMFGGGFLRFLLLLALCKEVSDSQLLWWPWFMSLSMAPILLLAARERTPVTWDAALSERFGSWRMSSSSALCTALAAILLVIAVGFHDPGRRHSGKLLIDEQHSDWEWTEQAFDTEWYGEKSTYNYYCWAEHLAKHYPLERGHQPLTPDFLRGFDAIILKVPTKPYASEEVQALHDFVDHGGGLVLIGDHTNVFGSGEFLNQIAEPFGLRYLYDSNYDLRSGQLSFYEKPCVLPHPVTIAMPSSMLFGGSCTLEAPLLAEGAIVGYRVRTLPGDYSQRSFFPEDRPHPEARGGAFFQSVAMRAGRGRIVAFTDSTIFSNFFIFMRGKIELGMGMVEWVYRENAFWWIAWIAGSIGLVLATRVVWIERGMVLLGILTIAPLPSVLTALCLELLDARAYAPPVPHTPFVSIAFDGEHSDFFIPEFRLGQQGDKDFDAFFVWVQRVGFVPRKAERLEDAFATARAIVVLDPVRPYRPAELSAMRGYVERGGSLLVLDDRENRASTAGDLLPYLGIGLTWPHEQAGVDGEVARGEDRIYRGAGTVDGATPLIRAPDGRVVLGVKVIGAGRVFVLPNSRIFGRASLGYVNMNPDADQLMLSRFEFELMRCLANPELTFTLEWMPPRHAGDSRSMAHPDAAVVPNKNAKKGD